ncbi:tetratricopeptide (TPR) repeat protein [Pedobacter sp. UYP30]|uniref:tetratricopeptide repeat protein n=1 Tax=Pedobacter sp. UYP30 TaxID=1756400 RepID=UPI00339797A2
MSVSRLSKLLQFMEQDPKDPFILYALATEYNNLDNTAEAFRFYLKLVAEHPSYVGTYYHLGKLYEKQDETAQAITTYQQGMEAARNKRDMHAFSELQGAFNSASGLDYEDD